MFFYEWVVPFIGILVIAAAIFYFAVKNRAGAGIRSEGRTVFDKPDADENPPRE
jgi:hypothetical protein